MNYVAVNKGGRPLGSKSKFTRDIKEQVLQAFEEAGGKEWFKLLMKTNPGAACGMLSKFIPTQIQAEIVVTKTVEINFLGMGQLPPKDVVSYNPLHVIQGEVLDEILT